MTDSTSIEMNYFVNSSKMSPNSFSTHHTELMSRSFSIMPKDTYSFIGGQNWFLSDFWMKDESEADADIKNGRFDSVDTVEELLALFDAQEKNIKKDR